MIKLFIFYASYFVFPFLVIVLFLYKKINKVVLILLVLLSILFIYARFIEVNWLRKINYDTVNVFNQETNIKIAVASDFHIGAYTKKNILNKVIFSINSANPDLVILPGDFLYALDRDRIDKVFDVLKEIKAPVYAVSGNHDSGFPGGDYRKDLKVEFEKIGIHFIDNEIMNVTFNDLNFYIVGLSDIWTSEAEYELFDQLSEDDKVILVSHNPDIAYSQMLDARKVDLLISGHTHGGQVRIPFLYKYAIPTEYDFDKGFSLSNGIQVFVTPGIGTVGLPLRLFMPPEVDIINIK